MEKPSNRIQAVGDGACLQWLSENNDRDFKIKTSSFIKLSAEHMYMIQFIDKIYETLNKEEKIVFKTDGKEVKPGEINNMKKLKEITIESAMQSDGRWYVRTVDIFDEHGNELDSMGDTLEEAITRILRHLK